MASENEASLVRALHAHGQMPLRGTCVALGVMVAAASARADDPNGSSTELAKQAQNPISSLISVPVQFNFNGGIGAFDRTQAVINLQPVLPLALDSTFTLVTRWILPFVAQPDAAQASGTTWGVGDFNPQIYLAIQLPHGFMLGPGVNLSVPTATDDALGSGKLGLGPALVGVWSGGPMLMGFLVNNTWSVAGNDARAGVDQLFVQPFINVNLPKGTSIVTAPQMLFDWERGTQVVPIGGGVAQLVTLGSQPVSFNAQAYWNVVRPPGGPDWTFRFQIQLLFPAAPKKKAD